MAKDLFGNEPTYTIKWTNSETGASGFPVNATPVTKKTAEAWIELGSVEGWKGELVPWSEYEKSLNKGWLKSESHVSSL